MAMNDIGGIEYVLKHSYVRCVVGAFDLKNMKALFGLDIDLFYPLSYKKSTFLHFGHHGTKFYDRYINLTTEQNILMMMKLVSNQNISLESFIIQDIIRHMLIEVMLFPETI